jgi:3-phosphoshikimate 1-carboxyvinyltransferase
MAELFEALEILGAQCSRPRGSRTLPATVVGPLRGGAVRLNASRSSQFVSALLLTLPTVAGDSSIELVGPIVSEPYIDATIAVLRHHGVRLRRRARHLSIPGGQRYEGRGMRVPGDASSAAYLWTAAAITKGRLRVTGVPAEWPQADLAVLGILRSAGATVRRTSDGATVEGRDLGPFSVDLTAAPDLYPLAGVLAASIRGRSRLRGAPHIIHKESDRRAGTVGLARAMGATVEWHRDGLAIRGGAPRRPFHLRGLSDHRLVMSAAVGALTCRGASTISDAQAVTKSFPGFWTTLASLREVRR